MTEQLPALLTRLTNRLLSHSPDLGQPLSIRYHMGSSQNQSQLYDIRHLLTHIFLHMSGRLLQIVCDLLM